MGMRGSISNPSSITLTVWFEESYSASLFLSSVGIKKLNSCEMPISQACSKDHIIEGVDVQVLYKL